MRPILNWIDKITEENGSELGCCVYDLAFKPDGSELLAAADTKILIYDGSDGTLLQSLKGHKDLVYAVAWSHDGHTFASGSADKSVILWTEHHEGTLKYSHGEPIQCLAFSPVAPILLSCAMADYGLWSQDEKNVQKQRVTGRICSCAWNSDGTIVALGMYEGNVQLRKVDIQAQNQEMHVKIDRPGEEPIWAVRFSPARAPEEGRRPEEQAAGQEILAVADCAQSLSFYDMDGRRILKEDRSIAYDPTCMEFFDGGQFLVVGGSHKQVQMYTRLGTLLGTVAQMDTWVWSVRTKPNSNIVVVGCVDGTLACYNLMFSTVHGLHKERYAFRDHMTDVVIQHLNRHVTTRIRCHDLVKKVAIYHHKLAIQLSDRLHIYRQTSGDKDGEALEFKLVERINKAFECSLLVVCNNHLILCQDRRLQCYDLKGLRQREWLMSSSIRYIKVIGGPPGRETILVGMRSGEVAKIFVDNPFPVHMMQLSAAIKCIDISLSRKLLAIVDENGICMVFNSKTNELIYQEPGCNSFAFNTENEQLMCYSGNGILAIRAGTMPAFTQRMMGFVVGFTGNKVFCLHMYAMTALEVPFSNQLYQYIEHKQYTEGYALSTLGVTEEDWRILALDALNNYELDVATRAFHKIRDHRAMQMIAELNDMRKRKEPDVLLRAHILASQRRFREVASLYRSHGYEHKAMEMFTDLRMFDEAQELMASASGETQKILMRKRADWARDSNEPKVAAEMFISSGDYEKAVHLIVENDWVDLAINLARKLDRNDQDILKKLALYFAGRKDYSMAAKIYTSMNDMRALVEMHVNAQQWTDAFAIADRYPKFVEDVYLPYARHLAEIDKFEEAQKAFHRAGRDLEALQVLEQLTDNAVSERRFSDAGHYHWMLAQQYLDRAENDPSLITKYLESAKLADFYYAYENVYLYCHQPFTAHTLEALLNMARYLSFLKPVPRTSQVLIYYTIAKIGKELGAYKLARAALDKLTTLRLPPKMEKDIEIAVLKIRARPFTDAEELQPICYRCGLTNALTGGLACTHCKADFILSAATFEILPLVEFFVAEELTAEEAEELISAEPPLGDSDYNPFKASTQPNNKKGLSRVVLGRDELTRLEKARVLVTHRRPPLTTTYLFNMLPSIAVVNCPACQKVFHMDEFEMGVLEKGSCPFCRTPQHRNSTAHYADDD